MTQPNVLFVMTDQQRFDTIAALGNADIYTPNLDRLVARGATLTNAYSSCPVCVPARYTILSGCEPPETRIWQNTASTGHDSIAERRGPYLPAAMRLRGYRTFGVGKFHTRPWDAPLGFDVQLHSEEFYGTPDQRARDSYASFIANEHPEYAWVEMLMGERTEMYYMPQMSPLPAELTVEAWAADRAIELIDAADDRPWFGHVSFIGPHPPFAPPQPFNRIYDPDRMPNPVRGELSVDYMDQQIPLMNYAIWAEDINDSHARALKARYYGEITYIDQCLGRILDAVEARPDADNTLVCFFSDHGEHLGDHNAWQKESFFEASTHVPLLVSWPARIDVGAHPELVSLADLFGLATSAAGEAELRDGVDLLGVLTRNEPGRDVLYGYYGDPGTNRFKLMVRKNRWKLIYLANAGRVQLFDLARDPHELTELAESRPEIVAELLDDGARRLARAGCDDALDGDRLRALPFTDWRQQLESMGFSDGLRVFQFDRTQGIMRFPEHPADVLRTQ
jgi:arylsulfatase